MRFFLKIGDGRCDLQLRCKSAQLYKLLQLGASLAVTAVSAISLWPR